MEDNRTTLKVMALSDDLEEYVRKNLVSDSEGSRLELDPYLTARVFEAISEKEEICRTHGINGIPIICRPDIRLYFRRFIEKKFPRLKVISYLEVPPEYKIEIIFEITIIPPDRFSEN